MKAYDEIVEEGLCAQTDPDAFFPEKGGSTAAAKKICAECPVLADCREFALGTPSLYGLWGGLTDVERRRIRRAASRPSRRQPMIARFGA
jgi:WhiB family redox-sensing transcriptional regulator